jgi:hypothetical protein
VSSFPPWAPISSLNSGEPATDAGATKHITEGFFAMLFKRFPYPFLFNGLVAETNPHE